MHLTLKVFVQKEMKKKDREKKLDVKCEQREIEVGALIGIPGIRIRYTDDIGLRTVRRGQLLCGSTHGPPRAGHAHIPHTNTFNPNFM